MSQSRRMSLAESGVKVIVGYIVATTIYAVLAHINDVPLSLGQNLSLVTIFTIAGFIQSYSIRRFFNWIQHR